MLEVEKRSFIDEDTYNNLLQKFKDKLTTIKQVTYYFDGDKDFRIMFTKDNIKLWLKEGKLHADSRKEYEVFIESKYKNNLMAILFALKYKVKIKWFRIRNKCDYKGIKLTIDYTVGYGYIIEGEVLVENENKVDQALKRIKDVFKELKIGISLSEEFNIKYQDYLINWGKYTNDIDEKSFLSSI